MECSVINSALASKTFFFYKKTRNLKSYFEEQTKFMLEAENKSIICGTGQDPAKTICSVAAERFVFIAHGSAIKSFVMSLSCKSLNWKYVHDLERSR